MYNNLGNTRTYLVSIYKYKVELQRKNIWTMLYCFIILSNSCIAKFTIKLKFYIILIISINFYIDLKSVKYK